MGRGRSLVIGPDGENIFQAPYGSEAEKICYVDIELENRPAKGHSWTDYWSSSTEFY